MKNDVVIIKIVGSEFIIPIISVDNETKSSSVVFLNNVLPCLIGFIIRMNGER